VQDAAILGGHHCNGLADIFHNIFGKETLVLEDRTKAIVSGEVRRSVEANDTRKSPEFVKVVAEQFSVSDRTGDVIHQQFTLSRREVIHIKRLSGDVSNRRIVWDILSNCGHFTSSSTQGVRLEPALLLPDLVVELEQDILSELQAIILGSQDIGNWDDLTSG